MKSGFSFRQGRSRPTSREERDMNKLCVISFLLTIVIIGGIGNLFYQFNALHLQQLSFESIKSKVKVLSSDGYSDTPVEGDIVYLNSRYTGSTVDPEFGLNITNSSILERKTEYCQWMEHSYTTCQTCTDDGGSRQGTYECDCVTTFYYTKGWRSHPIPSIFFDQPFSHNNPQRRALESKTWMSSDSNAHSYDIGIDESMLSYLRNTKRPLVFTPGGEPRPYAGEYRNSTFERLFGEYVSPRFEPVQTIFDSDFFISNAHLHHNFVYTNYGDGWFFSPYQEDSTHRLLRGFGQFLEGSLLDWQIMDLFDSCTAGDVRVRYFVSDPFEISAIGRYSNGQLHSITMDNGYTFGIIHAGKRTPEELFIQETDIQVQKCDWAVFLSIFSVFSIVCILRYFGIFASTNDVFNYCNIMAFLGQTLIIWIPLMKNIDPLISYYHSS